MSESEEEEKYCCIGLLEFDGDVDLSGIPSGVPVSSMTSVSYMGIVNVTTTTLCVDVACEGKTWEGIRYFSCDNEVEAYNKEFGTNAALRFKSPNHYPPLHLPTGVYFGTGGGAWAAKLGCCCRKNCPEKRNDYAVIVRGTVPFELHNTYNIAGDVANQIIAQIGYGGTTPPRFKACCKDCKDPKEGETYVGID